MEEGFGVFIFGVLVGTVFCLLTSVGKVDVQGSADSVLTAEYKGKVYRLVELK